MSAETFNGLQKVIQILCILTTLKIYLVSDQEILMKELGS